MENFKNFMQSFGLKKQEEKDPMAPSYTKPDGTDVIEQVSEYGKVVYEINKAQGLMISRKYTPDGRLYFDYARKKNYEIGHSYDIDGKVVTEIYSLYNEHNVMVRKTETNFEYYDNNVKSKEIITVTPSNLKTEIFYDETGVQKEKIIYQGSVKTWYDTNNKPIKREIDRGSGGIIKEDLQ